MFKSKYRIIKHDEYFYRVQIKRWWFPIWIAPLADNLHHTIKDAEEYAKLFKKNFVVKAIV